MAAKQATNSRGAARPAGRRPDHRTGGTTRPSRWTSRWTAIIAALAVLLLVTGWVALRGGPADSTDGAGQGSLDRIVLSSQGGRDVGDPAPEFSTPTTSGTDFSLPAGKPAVLFFMAGWCATCYPEAMALARINSEYGDQVAILAVSVDPSDSIDALRRFASQTGAQYGFVHDKDGSLTRALGVQALDTTVVVDGSGTIVFRDNLPTQEPVLLDALKKAGLT